MITACTWYTNVGLFYPNFWIVASQERVQFHKNLTLEMNLSPQNTATWFEFSVALWSTYITLSTCLSNWRKWRHRKELVSHHFCNMLELVLIKIVFGNDCTQLVFMFQIWTDKKCHLYLDNMKICIKFFTILGHRQREKKLKLIKSKCWLKITMRVRLSSPSPINVIKPSYLCIHLLNEKY